MKVNDRGLVALEILKSGVQGYSEGEVAGFAPDIAEQLVAKKLAKEYTGGKTAK